MGNLRFVTAAFILGFVLSGCFGPRSPEAPPTTPIVTIDPKDVRAPDEAVVQPEDGGVRILLTGPLEQEDYFRFSIPDGVTRVDARLQRADPMATASLSMVNGATDRIRCQPDFASAWFSFTKGETRCSGLTQLDPLPAEWRTAFRSLGDGDQLELLLSTAPLDGQAAQINLDNLSMPAFVARPTEAEYVVSTLDGSKLFVEVTRPETPDPVPTILVSSPYNAATRAAGLRAQNSTIADWVPRGYAVVSADVRGFAKSEGCVDVWGNKEQQDQVDLVEWVAGQSWSNGKVGFYGQSYVGTTPVEAASLAAPHLTTILAVAPVINAYEDWHFGGVPNGENTGSPESYQGLGADPADPTSGDPLEQALLQANGYCNEQLLIRSHADDPRAVYDAFYLERDFKQKAAAVRASVFYTQGFYDTNVKSQMIPDWFDALTVPKKALFGDWIHQHPPRADQELLFHAWFDQWLMDRDTGILATPVVEVRTNVDTVRQDVDWPPKNAVETRFGIDLAAGAILPGPTGTGTASYLSQAQPESSPLPGGIAPSVLTMTSERLAERLYLAGQPKLAIRATLTGTENMYFFARLWDVPADGDPRIITFGMLNAALRNGYETYDPVPPNQAIDYELPFLITEYVVQAGHRLELEIRSADQADWAGNSDSRPGLVELDGAGTALVLATLAEPGDVPAPKTAGPALPSG